MFRIVSLYGPSRPTQKLLNKRVLDGMPVSPPRVPGLLLGWKGHTHVTSGNLLYAGSSVHLLEPPCGPHRQRHGTDLVWRNLPGPSTASPFSLQHFLIDWVLPVLQVRARCSSRLGPAVAPPCSQVQACSGLGLGLPFHPHSQAGCVDFSKCRTHPIFQPSLIQLSLPGPLPGQQDLCCRSFLLESCPGGSSRLLPGFCALDTAHSPSVLDCA